MTNFKRVLKSGFLNFLRNGTVSFASVLIMTITLFIIGSIFFGTTILDSSLALVKDRVDVSVYFKTDAGEEDILALKDEIVKLPEIRSIDYISRDEALVQFRDKHRDNSLIISSLNELDENPLGAVLSIKANDPSQYESVAKFLENDAALAAGDNSIIDKVDFAQNKIIIDKLSSFIRSTEKLGLIVSLLFSLVAVLVTFNTVRLAIYTAKEEIAVMRLVGASNWYVRGPFIVSGIISGVASAVITLILFYPVTLWLGKTTEQFFAGINIFVFYIDNFVDLSFTLLIIGVFLGAVSSLLAVRRYLKI